MGQLVKRGCGEPVARMQAADKSRCEQQRAVGMNSGVAKVRGDGTPAVGGVDALEVLRPLIKGFVPPETFPTIRSTTYGKLEAVFIEVKISQGSGLRADVTEAERIFFVTAYIETSVFCTCRLLLRPDFNAADRLAEIAGAVMSRAIVGSC